MPIITNKYNRRKFIKKLSLGVAGAFTAIEKREFVNISSNYFVLISDTHIHADESYERRGVNLANNFKEVVRRILSKTELPAGVIINGDIAIWEGNADDYMTFQRLIEPLLEYNIQIYLTLGNHDNREVFYHTLSGFKSKYFSHVNRHVMVVDSPNAYLVLLDSLNRVNEPSGLLGNEQLRWLSSLLPTLADKPVIIFAHHYPDNGNGRGLLDYYQLESIILQNTHVKAYIFGHSHQWEVSSEKSFYTINIPSPAYTNREGQPLGFVHARFNSDGLSLKLDCLDTNHSWHYDQGVLSYSNLENDNSGQDNILFLKTYPNPFNMHININFKLLNVDYVTIDIYSLLGRYIMSLLNNKPYLPGEHSVQFTADGLAAGTYIIHMKTEKSFKAKKVTLIK